MGGVGVAVGGLEGPEFVYAGYCAGCASEELLLISFELGGIWYSLRV